MYTGEPICGKQYINGTSGANMWTTLTDCAIIGICGI